MEHFFSNAWLKAQLLAGRTVEFDSTVPSDLRGSNNENHHYDEFIFIKLNEKSRVRLVVDGKNPVFSIHYDKVQGLSLIDKNTNSLLLQGFELEDAVVHAPDQLFLGLYEYCKIGCQFCPLHVMHEQKTHYSLDSIYEDIDNSSKKQYSSIGITTSIPYYLSSEDVADEMIFTVKKIREKVGWDIPIGVSTRIPSERALNQLLEAGANEIRLNIEVPNQELSQKLMPHKPLEEIYESVSNACKVFGRGKVSSNIMLGVGESDQDVISAIKRLAKMGAIATLYPFDPFDTPKTCATVFKRPDAERLYNLAVLHKEILNEFDLDPTELKTMCPSCAASHILPGRDL